MRVSEDLGIQYVAIPDETYQRVRKIAEKKQKSVVDELGDALATYVEKEEEKCQLKEGKQLLVEG